MDHMKFEQEKWEGLAMGVCGDHGEYATKCKMNCEEIKTMKNENGKAHTEIFTEINILKRAIIGRSVFFTVVSLLGCLLCAVLGGNYLMQDRVMAVIVPLNTQVAVIESEVSHIKDYMQNGPKDADH